MEWLFRHSTIGVAGYLLRGPSPRSECPALEATWCGSVLCEREAGEQHKRNNKHTSQHTQPHFASIDIVAMHEGPPVVAVIQQNRSSAGSAAWWDSKAPRRRGN